MVALRRLSDACADGDRVLAVVRGSAVNNDGGSGKAAYTAPSPAGQADVLEHEDWIKRDTLAVRVETDSVESPQIQKA